MGVEFSALQAASCLACLPLGSSLLSAVDQAAQWSTTEYLLHGIMQMLAGKEIPFPWNSKATGIDGVETEALPVDQFLDWYGNTKWKEVEGWQVQ